MNICISCMHAKVSCRNGNKIMQCAYEQGAKIHRQYCPDYRNKENTVKWDRNLRKERERSKQLGYL